MSESTEQPSPPSDEQVVERLVPVWLREAKSHEASAAHEVEEDWKRGRLSPTAARELADWVTARVTETAFNEDEGPTQAGPAHISVSDKSAVHRWLATQGHDV
ncbi:hypothetical protein [Streptomyces subrutilus]|uniref:Uncharacterized protein n=1 Tax=Streptomyces subrutilus TaxID=36818 RepID=A0A1E5Q0J5_9ACTN|nr:hypothetical protein [Streptomyces subrutilus]OEJ35200.1 hypothetical protein BGK67_31300 [Streptomyces subrutilus]